MGKDLIHKLRMYGPFVFIQFALREFYLLLWMQGVKNSYSQRGEDIVIDHLLKHKKIGFYIDVGANDPIRFSNTNRFYKRGWYGINIEPDPICFEKIRSARSKDVNLNIGIGTSHKKFYFYKFFPDTLSTFSKDAAKNYIQKGFELVNKIKIEVRKLSDIIDTYCRNTPIDFISIDTEGYDLVVLKSNDWKRFRPKLVCIEAGLKNSEVTEYLQKNGYNEVFNNGLNKIFVDNQ